MVLDKRRDRRRRKPKVKPQPQPQPSSWVLTFEDHFDGDTLDPHWQTQYPWGRDRSSVGELQWYGEQSYSVRDSVLRLIAFNNLDMGRYVSGMISSHTFFQQTYGRFEIRCQVPKGTGLWPAFWLLPVDESWPPEIDVMEIIGSIPNAVSMTYHESVNGEHVSHGGEYIGPDFSAGMHTYAVEWHPDRMVWIVDGVERFRWAGVTARVPMYLIANLAVGGNWPGPPDAKTPFPAVFQIDYIRAWTLDK